MHACTHTYFETNQQTNKHPYTVTYFPSKKLNYIHAKSAHRNKHICMHTYVHTCTSIQFPFCHNFILSFTFAKRDAQKHPHLCHMEHASTLEHITSAQKHRCRKGMESENLNLCIIWVHTFVNIQNRDCAYLGVGSVTWRSGRCKTS